MPERMVRTFIHRRLTKARRAQYGATFYRRLNPDRYTRAIARVHRWERLWLRTYGVR